MPNSKSFSKSTTADDQSGTSEAIAELRSSVLFLALVSTALFLTTLIYFFYPFDNLLDRQGRALGADFPQFYIFGSLIHSAPGDVYREEVQLANLKSLFPGIPGYTLPLWYPPFLGALFAPLTLFSYPVAFGIYSVLTLLIAGSAVLLLKRDLLVVSNVSSAVVLLGVLGLPPALDAITSGQLSMLGVAILALTSLLILRDRAALAGAVLALSLYKPNLLALFTIGCVLRYPRMLYGYLPVAALLLSYSGYLLGEAGLRSYVEMVSDLLSGSQMTGADPVKVVGASGWLSSVFGSKAGIILTGIGAILTALLVLRERKQDIRLSVMHQRCYFLAALIFLNVAFNIYLPIYDTALLSIAMLLMIELYGSSCPSRSPKLLLYLYAFGPHLSQIVAVLTGIQLFPVALFGMSGAMLFRRTFQLQK